MTHRENSKYFKHSSMARNYAYYTIMNCYYCCYQRLIMNL